jgi:hypothetical protein
VSQSTARGIPALLTAALLLSACHSQSSSVTTDAGTDVDTDSATDTETETEPSYNCGNLPQGPFVPMLLDGPIASIDLAFDSEGHLVGADDHAIFETLQGGDPEIFLDGVDFRGGLGFLPGGDLVFADNDNGQLHLVDSEGISQVILSGLSYPRGLAVGDDGLVYVAELSAGRVRRVDPVTQEFEVLAGDLGEPAAIEFNPDYSILYIAGWGEDGTVHTLSFDGEGNPEDVDVFATGVGNGHHVGLGVDACGNVYVSDYVLDDPEYSSIYRISPQGEVEDEPIVVESAPYLVGLEWGAGIGGWEEDSLYISNAHDYTVYRIDIGVPSKPKVYP